MIRVLLADDHAVVRAGLRAILNAEETRATYGDGVFGGGPYKADEAVMQKLFDAAVGDIVARLSF